MIKSGVITLFVLLLLAGAVYFGVFDWIASSSATWLGILMVAVMLIIAFFVLGSPFKTNKD